jgi:hypothetical protein
MEALIIFYFSLRFYEFGFIPLLVFLFSLSCILAIYFLGMPHLLWLTFCI